jgi:hypothetical protein
VSEGDRLIKTELGAGRERLRRLIALIVIDADHPTVAHLPTRWNQGLTNPLTLGLGGAGQPAGSKCVPAPSGQAGNAVKAFGDVGVRTDLASEFQARNEVRPRFLETPLPTCDPAQTIESKSDPHWGTLPASQRETVLEMTPRSGWLVQREQRKTKKDQTDALPPLMG